MYYRMLQHNISVNKIISLNTSKGKSAMTCGINVKIKNGPKCILKVGGVWLRFFM